MRVCVITGSPHRKGASALLADEFIGGARDAGHDVFRFDAAFSKVGPCNGCDACGMGARSCVQKDDMQKLMPQLKEANVIALVTPLYYFGFSAQIKKVIDRFYADSHGLTGGKQSVLLATAWDSRDWTMRALEEHYDTISRYMQWRDAGRVLAVGCGVRSDIERSRFPKQAYDLGRGLR